MIIIILIILTTIIVQPLRAFRRARDGEAQGRVDWKRNGWPDAKFEVTSAKCDLGNEQQREKREESREGRENHQRRNGSQRRSRRQCSQHNIADKVVDIAMQCRNEARAPLTSMRAPLTEFEVICGRHSDQTFIRHPHKDTAVKPSDLGGSRQPRESKSA